MVGLAPCEHQGLPGVINGFCLVSLILNVLCHTIPHTLCRCEVKDVHSLQNFVLTFSEESDSLLFILCLL